MSKVARAWQPNVLKGGGPDAANYPRTGSRGAEQTIAVGICLAVSTESPS